MRISLQFKEVAMIKAVVTVEKPDGTLSKEKSFFCLSSAKSYYNRMKPMESWGWSVNLVVVG